jgi:hypothetical protein
MATLPADITRFMNNARMRLTGATDGVLQQELFSVMDEFFKGSNVWNEDIELFIPGMQPAGTIYQLAPASPALIDKLLWVFEKPTDTSIGRGARIGAYMGTPGEMTLRLQPSSDTTYIATVALTVDDPLDRSGYVQFPAWVLARYRDALLDGLLSRMMTQPSKPYTNPQMAVFHMRKFRQATASARVEWTRNNNYGAQAWAFPGGFSGGSQRGGRSGWGGPA